MEDEGGGGGGDGSNFIGARQEKDEADVAGHDDEGGGRDNDNGRCIAGPAGNDGMG